MTIYQIEQICIYTDLAVQIICLDSLVEILCTHAIPPTGAYTMPPCKTLAKHFEFGKTNL